MGEVTLEFLAKQMERVLDEIRVVRKDLGELKDEVATNSVQMAAMGQQMAGLTTAIYAGKSEMDAVKRRLKQIERRLDLREEDA